MKTYRVFLTRHYVAVEYYDVEASTPAKAKRAAETAVRNLMKDMRAQATDNGWHGDKPTEIPSLGYSVNPSPVKEVFRTKSGIVYKGE